MTVVLATWETEIEGSLDPGDTLSQNTEQQIRNDKKKKKSNGILEGTLSHWRGHKEAAEGGSWKFP